MKTNQLNFCLLISIGLIGGLAAGQSQPGTNLTAQEFKTNKIHGLEENVRVRRQESSNSTTAKPKKPRPSSIFNLISVLLSETREDAKRAFGEIGTLFNNQFDNSTQSSKDMMSTSTMMTMPANSTAEGDDDDDEESTREPFRINRNEFLGILRSNLQGLVNLFGKEFRAALKDSNNNVREFGRDFGNALRPYFT